MCFNFSKTSMERMKGVNPDLIVIMYEAIKYSAIDFGVPASGGLRTAGEQNKLYQDNVSKCDGIQTISNHQKGEAVDFYAYINGKASWDKTHLSLVAGCILSTAKRLKKEGRIEIDIKWGGSFGSDSFHGWDMPHVEVV